MRESTGGRAVFARRLLIFLAVAVGLVMLFSLLALSNAARPHISPTLTTPSIYRDVPYNGTYYKDGKHYFITISKKRFQCAYRVYFCAPDSPQMMIALTELFYPGFDDVIIGDYAGAIAVFTGERLFLLEDALGRKREIEIALRENPSDLTFSDYCGASAKRLEERDDGLYVILSDDIGCRIYPTVGACESIAFRKDGLTLGMRADADGFRCAPACIDCREDVVTALMMQNPLPGASRLLSTGADEIVQRSLYGDTDEVREVYAAQKNQAIVCVADDVYILYDGRTKKLMTYAFDGALLRESEKIRYIKPFGQYEFKLCGDVVYVFNEKYSLVGTIPVDGV